MKATTAMSAEEPLPVTKVTKEKVPSEQEDTQDITPATTNCCTKSCTKGKQTFRRFVHTDPYFKKWAEKSTIHGVEHVFIGQSFIRRSLWSLVFLGALIGCFYGIIDRSIIFSHQPTATTVTVEKNENGLPFPAVTICNLNPVQKSYADERNISDTLRFLLNADLALLSGLPASFQQEECYDILNKTKGVQSNLTIYDIYKEGVIPSTTFIQSCIFGNGNDCRSDLQLVLTTSGPCYTFNGYHNEPDKIVKSTGFRYGLRMIINISQSEYIQSDNGDAGIKVVLHNRSKVPDPDASGIAIPPGQHAYVAIYPERLVSCPELLECASEHTSLEFFPQRKYSLSACRINEYYKRSLETCGCTDIASVSTQNCTLNSSCCLAEALMTTEQALNCLPGCDEFVYKPSVSYSKYPSIVLAKDISSFFMNENPEVIESNILALNVYFGSLHTTLSKTEFTYGFTALTADIGGLFALFIGASIISLIEIIFLFFDEIKRIFCPRKFRTAVEWFDLKVYNAITIDNINDNVDGVNGIVNTTAL